MRAVSVPVAVAAVEANTAAVKGAAAKPGTSDTAAKDTKSTKETKETKATKPKHDLAAVNAALEKVKDAQGVPAAKKIISEVGGVAARKDIPENKYDDVVAACAKALEGEGGGEDDDL